MANEKMPFSRHNTKHCPQLSLEHSMENIINPIWDGGVKTTPPSKNPK